MKVYISEITEQVYEKANYVAWSETNEQMQENPNPTPILYTSIHTKHTFTFEKKVRHTKFQFEGKLPRDSIIQSVTKADETMLHSNWANRCVVKKN